MDIQPTGINGKFKLIVHSYTLYFKQQMSNASTQCATAMYPRAVKWSYPVLQRDSDSEEPVMKHKCSRHFTEQITALCSYCEDVTLMLWTNSGTFTIQPWRLGWHPRIGPQQCQNSIYTHHFAYAACSSSCISASGWPTVWKCVKVDPPLFHCQDHTLCGKIKLSYYDLWYFYQMRDVSSCHLTLCQYETYIVTRFITHRMISNCHPTFRHLHTSSGWQHPHWAHTHHYSYSGLWTKALYHCSTPLHWGSPV